MRSKSGVDPKFEALRNRDNCTERRFGWQPVFSKVEFRIAVAQRILNGESVSSLSSRHFGAFAGRAFAGRTDSVSEIDVRSAPKVVARRRRIS